jgi:mycothiol synthase
MDKPLFKPQLCMRRMSLEGLGEILLPDGYSIRTSQPGDEAHWAQIIRESFGDDSFDEARFESAMRADPAYQPERIFFVCAPDGVPCATASAYRSEAFDSDTGCLHYVGVSPVHAGKRLGLAVSLAALHKFRVEGLHRAVLVTDDFRLAAVKIYLALGFVPLIVHENQPARWDAVYAKLGIPTPARYDCLENCDG